MSSSPPPLQSLARQLLAGTSADSSGGEADRAMQACERLRPPLTKLAGASGFSSLMSRALALAARQAPSLKALRVDAHGSVGRAAEFPPDPGASETAGDGGVILVGELLGLLVTLIGEPLTLALVREAWPDASFKPTSSTKENP